MGIWISKFNTTAEFNTAESNLTTPHVSLTKDNMGVHYLPFDPYNGHDYVEIGGLKWATMNIGATAVTDTGLYFQWGDTQGYTASQVGSGSGKKAFTWADYKFGSSSPFTKYDTDGKTVLETSDDAAQAAWGGSWRMPTLVEYLALGAAVNSAWTNNYQGSGVKGIVLTDKNDSSKVLFFPTAGSCGNGSVYDVGSSGGYWSSSLFGDDVGSAYRLDFFSSDIYWDSDDGRYYGFPVRGVVGDLSELSVVAKFNVTSTSSPTSIIGGVYYTSGFSLIIIDDVAQPSIVDSYTFSTTGEHTVKYVLTDPTVISHNSFQDCTALTSIDIPDSVVEIKENAFANCYNLSSITIPSGVTNIEHSAFGSCTSFTSITIPNSVTKIGGDVFYEDTNISDVYCHPNPANLQWYEDGKDDFKSDGSTLCHVYPQYLSAYQDKFGNSVNVTFVGDLT